MTICDKTGNDALHCSRWRRQAEGGLCLCTGSDNGAGYTRGCRHRGMTMHCLLVCCRLLIAFIAACWMLPATAQSDDPPTVTAGAADDNGVAMHDDNDVAALRHYVAGIVDAVRRREHIPGVV